jgi:hypothetical protein
MKYNKNIVIDIEYRFRVRGAQRIRKYCTVKYSTYCKRQKIFF